MRTIAFCLGLTVLPALANGADNLADRARGVFARSCFPCHGRNGKAANEFFVLKPEQASASEQAMEIRGRVIDGIEPMPPPGHKASFQSKYGVSETDLKALALSVDDKAVVKEWIDEGAPRWEAGAESVPRGSFITDETIDRSIAADLAMLDRGDRVHKRFLSLANLQNAGDSVEDLVLYRAALRKLLSSLSWQLKPVNVRDVAGTEGTVLRFDLRELGRVETSWTAATWKLITDDYPYFVPRFGEVAVRIERDLDTKFYMLRADWFAYTTSRAPLYYELLGLPRTVAELEEKLLGVNVERDRMDGGAPRAGTTNSGVSTNHRILERHALKRWKGAYWVSFDFAKPDKASRSDILEFPLGPGSRATEFQHAGGEFIWNLPNGLQAYFLAKANGERLDEAPTTIVQNSNRADAVVIGGISCMDCHAAGMRDVDDHLREFVAATAEDAAFLGAVERIYPGRKAIQDLVDADRKLFEEALARVGAGTSPGAKSDPSPEPIAALVARFERKVDFKNAASELDMTEKELVEQFNSRILGKNRTMVRLRARLEHTKVSRDEFVGEFKKLRARFFETTDSPDETRPPKGPGPRALKGFTFQKKNPQGYDEYVHDRTKLVFVLLPGGKFRMGSPDSEADRSDDEGPVHEVELSPFLLAKHELTQEVWLSVMGANPSRFTGEKDLPVEMVTWEECGQFCAKTGLKRPTEAQWEYACRAGTTTPFSFGPTISPAQVNYDGNFPYGDAPKGLYRQKIVPVGSLPPSGFGLHAMHGNVWEWVEDAYDAEFYAKPAAREPDPVCTAGSGNRVCRGGSWSYYALYCRSANRFRDGPSDSNPYLGFRPALWPLPTE